MGVDYYAAVPSCKLLIYLGRNLAQGFEEEHEYWKEKFSELQNALEEAPPLDEVPVRRLDVGTLARLANVYERATLTLGDPYMWAHLVLALLERLGVEYEIVADPNISQLVRKGWRVLE